MGIEGDDMTDERITVEAFWPGALSLSRPAEFSVGGKVIGVVTAVEGVERSGRLGQRVTIEVTNEEYRTIMNAVNPVDSVLPYSIETVNGVQPT
jgi:hypothetical protein